MLRRLGALISCVVVAAASGVGSARAAPAACQIGKPVVDMVLVIRNAGDYGADGHLWALDDLIHRVRMWRTADTSYCAEVQDVGRFTAFAGVSPEGTGTVSAGVTGLVFATTRLRITGTFAPRVPTTGFIGVYDLGCDVNDVCPGEEPRTTSLYFSAVGSFGVETFRATYYGGRHGTWIQTPTGDLGDITG
jgi:hypothetical protein